MKPLATRADGLRQSDIRAVSVLVNAVGGINLGQGICDMPTPDPIKQAAKAAIDGDRSIYSHLAGIRPLRERILAKVQAYNGIPATSPDEVMVSVGSTGAFVSACFALLDPGDEVILFEPFYGYHRGILPLAGAVPRFVRTQRPDFAVDFDALRATLTPKTKAIVVCTPNNPSGKVWTRDELTTLIAIAQEHDLYLITDEIYEYMVYDGREHVSLASLPGAYERTVTLSGFSKTFNMTGWRLGYAVAPPHLIEKMGLLNDLFYICAPTPLQHGVAAAFDMSDTYYTEMLDAYTAKRQLLCETLEAIGFELAWPQGAYYVLANFEQLAKTQPGFEDDHAAARTLIDRAGVGTVAGNSFFADPADGRYYLRFCYAKEMPVLEGACQRLRDAFGT
ncbi:MAG: pyridoxal phosphate-dependent aminotransferase [Bacteroidota bacterium]